MNAKRIFALVLSLLMVMASFTAVMSVSADEDKFAPTNEEKTQMYVGDQGDPLGGFGKGASFGAMVVVPEGKRLTQINFHALATYNNNQNQIMFQVFQWDTDYATSVKGGALAQVTIVPRFLLLPTINARACRAPSVFFNASKFKLPSGFVTSLMRPNASESDSAVTGSCSLLLFSWLFAIILKSSLI